MGPLWIILVIFFQLNVISGYEYSCAEDQCVCTYVARTSDTTKIMASCINAHQLTSPPFDTFTDKELAKLTTIDMSGTLYCSSLQISSTIDSRVICSKSTLKTNTLHSDRHASESRSLQWSNIEYYSVTSMGVAIIIAICLLAMLGVWCKVRNALFL